MARRTFKFGNISITSTVAIFSVVLILVIVIIVIATRKNNSPDYTAIRDEMQGVLDSLFIEPGYTEHYNSFIKARPTVDPTSKLVTGNNFYTTKDVPDYTFYFRIFYNISDPSGTLDGNNMVYTYTNNDGTGTPDQSFIFNGYITGKESTNPKVAYTWLVTSINTYNQRKHTSEIYNQLKLSSPQ
jgi:hypothetical protein